MHQDPDPATRRAAAGLEHGRERVGVGLHGATAHPREVHERGAGPRGSVEADDGVPCEGVAGGDLREAREDGVRVRVRGGGGDGCEGEEEEVGVANGGGGEVAGGEEEGVALERVGGRPARTEAGEERRQRDGDKRRRHRSGMASDFKLRAPPSSRRGAGGMGSGGPWACKWLIIITKKRSLKNQ